MPVALPGATAKSKVCVLQRGIGREDPCLGLSWWKADHCFDALEVQHLLSQLVLSTAEDCFCLRICSADLPRSPLRDLQALLLQSPEMFCPGLRARGFVPLFRWVFVCSGLIGTISDRCFEPYRFLRTLKKPKPGR